MHVGDVFVGVNSDGLVVKCGCRRSGHALVTLPLRPTATYACRTPPVSVTRTEITDNVGPVSVWDVTEPLSLRTINTLAVTSIGARVEKHGLSMML